MKKKITKSAPRPERAVREMESYLSKNPDLREALRLFDIGMQQYARSLSYLSQPAVISRSDTRLV